MSLFGSISQGSSAAHVEVILVARLQVAVVARLAEARVDRPVAADRRVEVDLGDVLIERRRVVDERDAQDVSPDGEVPGAGLGGRLQERAPVLRGAPVIAREELVRAVEELRLEAVGKRAAAHAVADANRGRGAFHRHVEAIVIPVAPDVERPDEAIGPTERVGLVDGVVELGLGDEVLLELAVVGAPVAVLDVPVVALFPRLPHEVAASGREHGDAEHVEGLRLVVELLLDSTVYVPGARFVAPGSVAGEMSEQPSTPLPFSSFAIGAAPEP